jgi:hypothetical protein
LPRDLVDISKTTPAGRFYAKMQADIAADLGGRRDRTRIEIELISAFAGAATTLQYLNRKVMLGDDIAKLDLASYSTLASTMLRIGSRLSLSRRQRDVTDLTLSDYLEQRAAPVDDPAEEMEP